MISSKFNPGLKNKLKSKFGQNSIKFRPNSPGINQKIAKNGYIIEGENNAILTP